MHIPESYARACRVNAVPPTGREVDQDAFGALDILEQRWALRILVALGRGPMRFGDLRASLPAISANILTRRLREFEKEGLIVRERLPPPASIPVYRLTPRAEPVAATLEKLAHRLAWVLA